MSAHPGTVTFLFTDVEGSTRLLRELGPEYPSLLDEHFTIVEAAVEAAGGSVVDRQGDALFATFPRAQAAIEAATEAQRALARTRVRVRMGLHTAEPTLEGGQYVGLGVHRAKRICDAAHGGQVLLSEATRAVVEDDLRVKDVGVHRLKDFDRPMHMDQLQVDGLRSSFPPPRTPPRRGRRAAAVTLAVVLAACAALAFLLLHGDQTHPRPVVAVPNSVAVIDPARDRVVADVRVGFAPRGLAADPASVWVGNTGDATVSEIDPSSLQVKRTIGIGGTAYDLALSGPTLWVATDGDKTLIRVDTQRAAVQAFRLPQGTAGAEAVAVGGGYVWVGSATLLKIDPRTGAVLQRPRTDCCIPVDVLYTPHGVWTNGPSDNVYEVSRRTLSVLASTHIGSQEFELAYGYGAVWVSASRSMTTAAHPSSHVWKIDPVTAAVQAETLVGGLASGIAVGANAVWVANNADGTVSKLDPKTATVTATIHVGGHPSQVTVADGRVWVSVQ